MLCVGAQLPASPPAVSRVRGVVTTAGDVDQCYAAQQRLAAVPAASCPPISDGISYEVSHAYPMLRSAGGSRPPVQPFEGYAMLIVM